MQSTEEQKWWWVSALYKAVDQNTSRRRHLWQRTVFLIRAREEHDATRIAEDVAQSKEHEYRTTGKTVLKWKFQEIENLSELFDEEIGQGTEVYWTFFERTDRTKPLQPREET